MSDKVGRRIVTCPLVSILIVTYNQAEYIGETLESAIAQDDGNLEIVVADDASRDGTAQIIHDYAQKYPELIVPVLGGVNLGITGNCNCGLAVCQGKYIAFLGGDDLVLPGKITKQVEWLEENDRRVLCYHDTEVFDVFSGVLYKTSDRYRFHAGTAELILRYGCFFDAVSVMIRRPSLPVVFDGRIPLASDWLYWFEIVENQNGIIGHIDGVFGRHRMTRSNITKDRQRMLKDKIMTLNIIAETYSNFRHLALDKIAEVYFSESYRALSHYEILNGLRFLGEGVRRVIHGNWKIPMQSIARRLLGLKY
ncbi:MAG: glycosyltransferase [Desulfuromonadaceae bacterium]|nr:glycosyltransferase [Desulfuromonadaceae bacterium]